MNSVIIGLFEARILIIVKNQALGRDQKLEGDADVAKKIPQVEYPAEIAPMPAEAEDEL